ncbi:glycosyltransferase family 2 protein [Aureisphaera galaxeae]|uniref:glycosyltransferase family 2 protein n=1 Tax=Aureisphaera galaxeae TaxID=1538023 RepID=UPI0023503E26|nr:glycosyltransferase family 2 protein [Aureisphaera galaxeae]MDC8003437.1 glycosyltransferase family 2 protein [Aureisphaera galaxeae]
MEQETKISAVAITLNEGPVIEGFIKSLHFVDEIIIVDSYSTDDTVSLASQFDKVKVVERAFDNFSEQKNFAIAQASNDWILFFDPDEEITEALANEIQNVLKNPKAVAYSVKRQLHFMGKRIKYSGFQTDWVVRVFKKEHGRYNGNLVHETLDVNGTIGKLKARLPHHTYKSLDDYTGKLHRYSTLQARMLYKRGKKPNLYHFLFRPWYRFWHQYLLRLGILDGKEGFILAYINAFSVFKRYVNLWLLYRKIN